MAQDRAGRPDQRPDPFAGSGENVSTSAPSQPGGGGDNNGAPVNNGAGGGTYFLGRYRVVDEIGIGGMASVHLARMDGPGGFQKWVAIKRIHAHLIEDDSFVHMFLDEARVAARISHPNVANVFDLGKDNDSYWIAMEYLHGEPLREVMRRTEEMGQPMPPEIACRVIADAAEGLHAAHELLGKNGEKLGLVHRDVTPHNLFVTYDGTTKVVDFGIAKFSSRTSNTRAGTLKGKLAYMSPEQVHGEGIDRRTDIFALGVVLWELTTGQRLFRMESDLDTLAKVQECNVPRPSSLIRGYPIDLEKIVMKALAKNRGERFRTARELSRALQSLLMRRGLFIASDEVAAYVQAIFQDRIQKREAHLRWAADVTQTINIDGLLAKQASAAAAAEPSMVSFNSDVQEAPPGRPVVRPAAGMPAQPLQQPQNGQNGPGAPQNAAPGKGPLAPSTARLSQPPGAPKPTPKQLASTVGAPVVAGGPASGGAGAGAPRPVRSSAPPAAPQHRETFRPPGQAGAAPQGRIVPAMPQQARVQIDSVTENDDPGQMDDGPTIQASVHLGKATVSGPYGSPLGNGAPVPSLGASLQGPAPGKSPDPNSYANEEDDNEDATLIQAARSDGELGAPAPAAGRPASSRLGLGTPAVGQRSSGPGAAYAPARPAPARVSGAAHPSLPPVVVSPPGRASMPDPRQQQQDAMMSMDVTQGMPNFPPSPQTQQGLQPQQPQGYSPWGTQQPAGPFGAPDQMNMQGAPYGQPGQPGQVAQPGLMPPPGMNDPFGLGMPGNPQRMPSMPGMSVDPNYFGPPMMQGSRHEPTEMASARPKKANLLLIGLVCGGAALVLSLVVLMWPAKTVAPGVTADDPASTGTTAPTDTTNGSNTTQAPSTGGGTGPFAAVRAGFNEASQPAPAGTDTTTAPNSAPNNAPSNTNAAASVPPPPPAPPPPDTTPPPVAAAPDPTPTPAPAPVAQNTPAPSNASQGSSHSGSSSGTHSSPTPATSGAKGSLTVICHPQCDQIVDNGKPMGGGPLIRAEVAAGEHKIKMSAGATNKMVSVIVVAGELRMVNQSMTP